MGQCSTFYTDVAGSGARRNNVRLATETLNGVCVMPGEVFSYNATIGKRTEEKGYREAPVYANGLSATEPGGGVCQVSSTLFNAVLLADLNIVSRSPHSRPASYVPVGLDATVSWPEPDFKFQNDTPYPVYIVSKYENEKCYMSIYGQQLPDGIYVTMEAVTTEVLKSDKPVYIYTKDLPKGQQHTIAKAREGYLAEAYKVYHYADGTEMDRMLYIRSEYPAVGPTIRVGS